MVPSSSFPENSIQSNITDEIINQESREFVNGVPNNLNEAQMSTKSNELISNYSNLDQNQFSSGLNSLPQQTQSAFSVVSPQSRTQRAYPNNAGLPPVQQPQLSSNFPSQSDSSNPKSEYQFQQSNFLPQQSKVLPQQSGLPSQPNSVQQHQSDFQQKPIRSEEHTSELQSPNITSYAVFCLKKKNSHCAHPTI